MPQRRGQRQAAWQIRAASSAEKLKAGQADLWDSGKQAAGRLPYVVYGGKPLRSGQRVFWTARAWDERGVPSPWAAPAWFETGLLAPADWKARWITRPRPYPADEDAMFADDPAPLLRQEFLVSKPIARARAYASGLGYYELRLNGQKVGENVLEPAWTSYAKRVFYTTYDITPLLRRGRNAVGMLLGNGWYNPLPLKMWGHLNLRAHLAVGTPRGIAQIEITYADGTRQTLGTQENWKVGDGPIVRNSVYLGEVYDARREQPGWDEPGFAAVGWQNAKIATETVGPLRAPSLPPIRVGRRIRPARITQPQPHVSIFDMGENFAGVVTLKVRGPRHARITLRYGELLYPDGTLNPMTSAAGQIKNARVPPGSRYPSTAWQSDAYICKGEGEEIFTPRFTFHGFRYVEVTGLAARPTREMLTGLALHSDVASVGTFASSDPTLNRIQSMARRTFLSNLFGVQSDCPHREKFGYGGDIVATSDALMLNFDMARFYAKTVEDFADDQRPNGGFTETAPYVGIADASLGERAGPVGWGTAHPLLLWQLYQYYGDRELMAAQYPNAQRWMALLESKAAGHILDNGIGDHETLAPKSVSLTGTAFYYLNARLMAQMARVLGRHADAARYERLAADIRDAFNARFLAKGTGKYDTGTQANQSFALALGLVPVEEVPATLAHLISDIEAAHQGHLSTGIFGTKYLLNALSAQGRADVAHSVAAQRGFPGWRHMLENDATTLWEHWAFSDNTFSHNHPMFGSVSEWFFKGVAGIAPDADAIGFDRVRARLPRLDALRSASARYASVRGTVAVRWNADARGLSLHLSIPVGVTARIALPLPNLTRVTESGKPLRAAPGVRIGKPGGGGMWIEVGSGQYLFRLPPLLSITTE